MPRKKATVNNKELNTDKKTINANEISKKINNNSKYSALSEFDKKPKRTTKKQKTSLKSKSNLSQKSTKKETTTVSSSAKSATAVSTQKKQIEKKVAVSRNSKKTSSKTMKDNSEDLISTISQNVVEYYDLPYRYNQTVVKILAQNPNTLFVYWDISDDDIENFKKQYGDNFLYITKPVLLIHNITENYSFEIDIDDFANNWYINVDDSKCEYSVELCRKPRQNNSIENIITNQPTDFINISYSNTIEMPNDKILYLKDGDFVYFKNIKTNKIYKTNYKSAEQDKRLKEIYSNYNILENEGKFDFQNPSSQNPSSNVM